MCMREKNPDIFVWKLGKQGIRWKYLELVIQSVTGCFVLHIQSNELVKFVF